MYNFLPEVTADCTDILMVNPQSVMPSKGRKNQIVHTFEDGRESVAIVSDTSIFEVELQWGYVSDAERSTIMELFHNPTKANGSARSFYWQNPIDNNMYVVLFLTPLRTVFKPALNIGIETMKLRVLGSAGQTFSGYTDMSVYVESGTYMRFI